MSGEGRIQARFADVAARAGHYESFYLKACAPEGGRAVWIRHTVHKRPGSEPTASLWFTLFDANGPGPRALKASYPGPELSVPAGAYVKVAGALLEPGRARGSVSTGDDEARWDLRFADPGAPLRHLPYDFLYRTSLPRTKLESPYPAARFTGTVSIGSESVELAGWPGMVGHNWGAEHAERWIWIHAAGLGGRDGDYLDVAAGRIKVGPMTTPWIANGRIVVDGEPHRLGGLDRVYGTELRESPTGCELTFPGKGVNVKGSVSGPRKDVVGWVYADPDGPEHNTVNCSIADLELKVERPGRKHARIRVERGAAYELGMRETDHGIPLQPFPDP